MPWGQGWHRPWCESSRAAHVLAVLERCGPGLERVGEVVSFRDQSVPAPRRAGHGGLACRRTREPSLRAGITQARMGAPGARRTVRADRNVLVCRRWPGSGVASEVCAGLGRTEVRVGWTPANWGSGAGRGGFLRPPCQFSSASCGAEGPGRAVRAAHSPGSSRTPDETQPRPPLARAPRRSRPGPDRRPVRALADDRLHECRSAGLHGRDRHRAGRPRPRDAAAGSKWARRLNPCGAGWHR